MIPRLYRQKLDQLTYLFGGYDELSAYLSDAQLEYLCRFPGSVIPFYVRGNDLQSSPIDLTVMGYDKGTPFTVCDHNQRFLYRRTSNDGLFGSQRIDRSAVYQLGHAQYLQLSFVDMKQAVLWVFWHLSIASTQSALDKLKAKRPAPPSQPERELVIVAPRNVSPKLYYLEASTWRKDVAVAELETEGREVFQGRNVAHIFPKQDAWLSLPSNYDFQEESPHLDLYREESGQGRIYQLRLARPGTPKVGTRTVATPNQSFSGRLELNLHYVP